jgi:hypothetical protein
MRFMLACAIVGGGFAISLAAQDGPPPAATGLIVGQVVDGTSGKGVPDAVVDLMPTSTGLKRVRVVSDQDGRFYFNGLQASVYNMRAAKSGYVPALGETRRPNGIPMPILLAEGQKLLDLKMPIWKFGVITGVVTDEAGEPMPDVEVRAYRRTLAGGKPRFVPIMATNFGTDDRGVYRIPVLPPGDYMVAIPAKVTTFPWSVMTQPFQTWGPEFGSAARSIAVLGNPNNQQFGDWVVQSESRSPIPPAPINDRVFAYPTLFHPPSDGGPTAPTITVGAGEERTVNLQMRSVPVTRISGTIVGPSGPMARTALRLVPAGRGESTPDADFETATGVTNERGEFTLFATMTGQYLLKVLTPRSSGASPPSTPDKPVLWATEPLTLGAADLTGLAITVRPVLTLSARFEFRGTKEPPAQAQMGQLTVTLDSESGGPAAVGRSDERGQIAFGAPGGSYTVRATEPIGWRVYSILLDGKEAADTPVDLKADAPIVVAYTDQTTQVTGIVRDDRNEPDSLGIVAAFPTNRALWIGSGASGRRTRSSQTSKTGTYIIRNLPAGEYFVASIPDGMAESWSDPKNLAVLSATATRVEVIDGGNHTQNLRKAR